MEEAAMTDLVTKVFEGAPVRIIAAPESGEPWFVLADVCRVLDVVNAGNAAARLDADERGVHSVDTPGGGQEMTVINESGLYSLILTSRKEAARRFKMWVTGEVLPSIRKTGGYMMAAPEETPEELTVRLMGILQDTITGRKAQLAVILIGQKPAARRFRRWVSCCPGWPARA
jgi:anti-repressor protein